MTPCDTLCVTTAAKWLVSLWEFDPFGAITFGKMRWAARLNPFTHIQVGRAPNRKQPAWLAEVSSAPALLAAQGESDANHLGNFIHSRWTCAPEQQLPQTLCPVPFIPLWQLCDLPTRYMIHRLYLHDRPRWASFVSWSRSGSPEENAKLALCLLWSFRVIREVVRVTERNISHYL